LCLLMEAPRDSEGAAGRWARPVVMGSGTAFDPQPSVYQRGLAWERPTSAVRAPLDCDAGGVATSGRPSGKRSEAMDGERRV